MLEILKAPFPNDKSTQEKLVTAFLVGIFVSLFLFLFQPFGMDGLPSDISYKKSIGYGIVSFIGMCFCEFALPKFFPQFFEERSYTLIKELWMGAVLIFTIGIGNALFYALISGDGLYLQGILMMIWHTFLVGIFPLTFITLLSYSRQLSSNLKSSNEISLGSSTFSASEHRNTDSTPTYTLSTETEQKQINLSALLYMESVGNYVNVAMFDEGNLTRNLYRKTLKSIEEDAPIGQVVRCHRSYIVNLEKVKEVNGNAQGLKLTLEDCDVEIPVSRKYICTVKKYFTSINPPKN